MTQRMIYQRSSTRKAILDAAEKLFLENGFLDTQMKDVAEAAGMSRQTLYRYYRDKGDLGFAILGMSFNRLGIGFEESVEKAQVAGILDARELLLSLVLGVFANEAYEADLRFMAEFDTYYSGQRLPEDFNARISSLMGKSTIGSIQKTLQQGIDEGSIRSDIPPGTLLNMLIYSVKTLQQEILKRGAALTHVPEQELKELVPALAKVLMDGLKPPESE